MEVEAFADVEPLPDFRADLRAAMGAFVTARCGGARDAKLSDFLPTFSATTGQDGEQTEEEMDQVMQRVAGIAEAKERRAQKLLDG